MRFLSPNGNSLLLSIPISSASIKNKYNQNYVRMQAVLRKNGSGHISMRMERLAQ